MRNPDNEDYTWKVYYTPSDENLARIEAGQPPEWEGLEEYPDDPEHPGHTFADIDQSRVYGIELIAQRPHLVTHAVRLDPQRAERLIFFRRRMVPMLVLPPAPDEVIPAKQTVTVIGYQRTIGTPGENVAVYQFAFSDGTTLLTSDYNAV